MKQNLDSFVVESTPVLDVKKQGPGKSTDTTSNEAAVNWDADRTEVYADVDADEAIASLVLDNGESFPITTFPFVMGRGNECDLVLTGKGVSRRHAEIVFQSGRFVVNDLESLNGIKVNGYKIARVILEENDVIKLGEVSLTFFSGSSSSGGGEDTEARSAPRSGLFARKETAPAAPVSDDTFGPSPMKKMLTMTLFLLAGVMVVAAGYLYLNKNQAGGLMMAGGSSADRAPVVQQSGAQQSAAKPPPAPAQNQDTVSSSAPPPASSMAPPPSIAMSNPAAKQSEPEAKVADIEALTATPEPVKAEPKPEPAPKPVSKPKPVANLNNEASAALADAERSYLQGNANQALASLKPFVNNSAVTGATRRSVLDANQNIGSLYDQFMQAQSAFSQGDKELAFSLWTDFMSREDTLFGGKKSTYSRSIQTRVMDEYVSRGNEASEKSDYHTAYQDWQKALEIGDSVAAKIAIENQTNRARQLYRQALRLEYVNAEKAKGMWREVTQLLPPGTEYHTKASSKLAWYEKWGT